MFFDKALFTNTEQALSLRREISLQPSKNAFFLHKMLVQTYEEYRQNFKSKFEELAELLPMYVIRQNIS